MPYAKLTITIPQTVWIGTISRAYPEVRFRMLAATANESKGFARVEIIGASAAEVCDEIETYDSVTDLTVIGEGTHRRRIQLESTVPVLLTALQDAGVPLQLPVDITEGELTLETTIPRQQLSALGEKLDQLDITYEVEQIQSEATTESLLTDRQRWLLHEAIEEGYYDTPRRITLVELAEEVDIAKSTCSEILHRAEEQVLKRFISGECEHSPDIPIRAD